MLTQIVLVCQHNIWMDDKKHPTQLGLEIHLELDAFYQTRGFKIMTMVQSYLKACID